MLISSSRTRALIHLTEIELGYDDGRGNLVVVPLYEMRPLVKEVVKADKVDDAQRAIFAALHGIRDYRGREASGFIAEDSWLTRINQCAVKGAFSQWVRFPPGTYRSSR